MVTLSQLDLTTVEASASEPNWRKCYIAITRKSEIKQSSTLGLWGLGFPNTQSWFRHANRRERWPGKRSPAPRLLGVPSPPPPTPPKAVRGPSYTVPPPNPLSHATAPLLSLEYSASSRSHPLTKARGAEVPEPPCHFSSRAASTASILTQRPARFKFAHFRLQPGRSAHPRPLGGGTRGDAGGGKDLERRGCGPVGCCPGVARLASLPFVSLPT